MLLLGTPLSWLTSSANKTCNMSGNAFLVTDELGTLNFHSVDQAVFFCFTFLMKHVNVLFTFQMQSHYIFVVFRCGAEGDFSVLPLSFWGSMRRSWGEMHYYDYESNINKLNYKWSRLFSCNMVLFFRNHFGLQKEEIFFTFTAKPFDRNRNTYVANICYYLITVFLYFIFQTEFLIDA